MFFSVSVQGREETRFLSLQELSVGIYLHVPGKTLNTAWEPLPSFLQAYAGVSDLKHMYI